MDNNNVNPQQAAPQPAAPVAAPPAGGSSNKMVLWFVIGLVVILALVGGIYLFLSRQQAAAPKPQAVVSQTPTPVVESNLEDDLNNVDVDGSVNNDFAPVDQDLQQL